MQAVYREVTWAVLLGLAVTLLLMLNGRPIGAGGSAGAVVYRRKRSGRSGLVWLTPAPADIKATAGWAGTKFEASSPTG